MWISFGLKQCGACYSQTATNSSVLESRSQTHSAENFSPKVLDRCRTFGIMNGMPIRSDISRQGFSILREYKPGQETIKVVSELGHPICLPGGRLVHQLRPKSPDASAQNTYSGQYGLASFPLHTDLAHWVTPPRFVLLRAVVGSAEVSTNLLDGTAMIRDIGSVTLARSLVRSRRPIRGLYNLLRILELKDSGERLIRWDERYITHASPAGMLGIKAIKEWVSGAHTQKIFLSNPGDILVVDNWRMLHGRGPVPVSSANRILDRCYMKGL